MVPANFISLLSILDKSNEIPKSHTIIRALWSVDIRMFDNFKSLWAI